MLDEYITNPYLRALAIIAIVFIALRIFVFILEKIILRLVSKTKTDVDDLIVSLPSLYHFLSCCWVLG